MLTAPSVYAHPLARLWRGHSTAPVQSAAPAWRTIYVDANTEKEANARVLAVACLLWGRELGDAEVDAGIESVRPFTELEADGVSPSAALRVQESGFEGGKPHFYQGGIFVTPRAAELQDALACALRSHGDTCAFDTFKPLPRKEFEAVESFDRDTRKVWAPYPRLVQLFGRPYKSWHDQPGTFWPVRFADGLVAVVASTGTTRISKAHPDREQPWALCGIEQSRGYGDRRAPGRLAFLIMETRPASVPPENNQLNRAPEDNV